MNLCGAAVHSCERTLEKPASTTAPPSATRGTAARSCPEGQRLYSQMQRTACKLASKFSSKKVLASCLHGAVCSRPVGPGNVTRKVELILPPDVASSDFDPRVCALVPALCDRSHGSAVLGLNRGLVVQHVEEAVVKIHGARRARVATQGAALGALLW